LTSQPRSWLALADRGPCPGPRLPLPEVVRTADAVPLPSADGQPTAVTLPAEIDILNAHRIGEQLAAACLLGATVVIADMTATTLCDNAGLRMLMMARRQAAALGTELRVHVPSPHIMRIMKIEEIDAELPLYQSLDEALAGLGAHLSADLPPAGSNS